MEDGLRGGLIRRIGGGPLLMVWRRFRVCAAEGDPGDALRQEQLLTMPCVVEVIELRWERQCPWRSFARCSTYNCWA